MTKRILAAILAVVLVVTSLAVPAFASPTAGANLVKDSASNKLTLTWSPVTGAKIYQVSFFKDGASVYSTTVNVANEEDNTGAKCTVSYTPSVGGNYTAQVSAKEIANGPHLALYTSSAISIPITGTGSGGLQIESTGNSTNVSWANDGYSTNYYVEYTHTDGKTGDYVAAQGGERTSTTISLPLSDIKSITVYKANVAGNAYNGVLASWTNSGSSTGGQTGGNIQSNGINVTINGSIATITWNAVAGASRYEAGIKTSADSGWNVGYRGTNNYTYFNYIPGSYYQIRVIAYKADGTWSEVGTATINSSSIGGGTGAVLATRSNSMSTAVSLAWNASSTGYYLIEYARTGVPAASTMTFGNTTTIYNIDPRYDWTFVVKNSNGSTVGYAILKAGATSSSGSTGGAVSGILNITRGYNTSSVTWNAVSGATGYIVTHKPSNGVAVQVFAATNQIVLNYGTSDTWTVTVQAILGGSNFVTVGSASVSPSGVVQGGSGSGSTTGGKVTQGNNCTVTSYSNYAYLTWNASGTAPYTVIYYLNNDSSKGQMKGGIYGNSVQLSIANSYDYTVYVFDSSSSSPIASATVKAQTSGGSSSSYDKTQIVNLTVTPKNGWTTTLSWGRVSGAVSYMINYGPIDSNAGEQGLVYTTSFDLPYGPSRAYQAYVYALTSSGKLNLVGYVINVPGTTADSDDDTDDTAKDYPTNFKATSGNEKVTLAWDAVEDAGKYTIYYRRATSNTWLKAGTTSRVAVNITGLENGISYEFKVSVNGKDSGVVKISPSASNSTTVTAPDPKGDEVVIGDEIKLTSVTSTSRGTITASWTAVSGATSYEVYVAEGSSSTYKKKGEFTGTTAVISGLTSGQKYKVRILVNPYEGSKATALSNCEYMQVTVK